MAERECALETMDLKALFGGVYAGRKVLVTGHTGFKGSWLALWLTAMGARVGGLALEPDTDPSHWHLLGLEPEHDARADLREANAVVEAVQSFGPEVIFHLAAQSLVRRGYRDPVATFATNVGGLVNLLEAARECGAVRVIVNATTDKVYETPAAQDGHVESDPLGGHDPYSTSKACAELVSACYRRSYFTDGTAGHNILLATARAGNVIGGGDWCEDRLVPDAVRAAISGQPLRLRNPDAIRPWQHVLEPLSGYLRIGQLLLEGRIAPGAWNLGPSPQASLAVGDVVRRLQQAWPALRVELDTGPHPQETQRLALESGRAARELDWHPVWDAATSLDRTMDWYRAQSGHGELRSHGDLASFVRDARRAGMAWAT